MIYVICRRAFAWMATTERTQEPSRRRMLKICQTSRRRCLSASIPNRNGCAWPRSDGMMSSDELPSFWREGRLPTPQQQADNLILFVGDNQKNQFEQIKVPVPELAAKIGLPISVHGDSQGWQWLHQELAPAALYQ